MHNPFEHHHTGLESPATHAVEVEPNDTQDLPAVSRAIAVAQSGLVRLTTLGGQTVLLWIAAGAPFPIRATRIWADGTTAGGLVLLY